MEESSEARILDLYEDLKGVEFQGVYRGVEEKRTREGVCIKLHLVEVVSSHVKTKMDGIIACDPEDRVWKAIRSHIFWVHQISGGEPDKERQCSYVLDKTTHNTQLLKWQKKKYSTVINVHLNIVPP